MAAMLAAAVSCNESLDTDSAADFGSPIKFRVGMATKAFLGSSDINTANTELTIWGFAGSNPFIEGVTAKYDATESGWDLGKDYYWGGNVTYKFFSYLTKDKNGKTAPTGISVKDSTLKVPSRTFDFTATDSDFDFCYSEVVNRPADNADHSVVAFNLNHLYSAIAFSAHNYTGSSITIKDVTLVGLKNKKSATIAFTDSARVTYPQDSVACTWTDGARKLNSADITIASNGDCADIIGTGSTSTTQYYMFWAQTSDELEATGWIDSNTQPTGGAYLKIVYVQDGVTVTKYAKLPQDLEVKTGGAVKKGWPEGTKRIMQIAFRDDWFTLQLSAAPWDYSEPSIKYAVDDDELKVGSPLKFDESTCTVDEVTHTIYFKGGNPITGSFKLTAPEGATWIISKEGDYDAFEVDNVTLGADGLPASRYGDKMDCNYGAVDVTDGNTFTIYPMAVAAGKDYSIQISFSVRYPNGESYCIDDLLQKDKNNNVVKWTIILTK